MFLKWSNHNLVSFWQQLSFTLSFLVGFVSFQNSECDVSDIKMHCFCGVSSRVFWFLCFSCLLSESDLQICQHRAPTCCTKKMEESYQAAVRRERTQSIQALNFELKYMIVGHITAFQGRKFWTVYIISSAIQKKALIFSFPSSCIACCCHCLMVCSLFFGDCALDKGDGT